MTTRETEAALAKLRSHFGSNLDKDSLEAVLAVCNNDVSAAITFLTATGATPGYDAAHLSQQSESRVPSDYPIARGYVPTATSAASSSSSTSSGGGVKGLFLREATMQEHFTALTTSQRLDYICTLLLLLKQGVEIIRSARPKILACLFATKEFKLADFLLTTQEDQFNLPIVVAALTALDASRQIRQLEGRLARQHMASKRAGLIRARINELKVARGIDIDAPSSTTPTPAATTPTATAGVDPLGGHTLTGALAKRIKKWVRSISADKLAFYALALPREPWCALADLIHLNPATDFASLQKSSTSSSTTTSTSTATETTTATTSVKKGKKATKVHAKGSFLNIAFGEAALPGTMLYECLQEGGVHEHNVVDVVSKYPVPYSFLRLRVKPIPDEAKVLIARYAPLDQLLWYHEELACPPVNALLLNRLRSEPLPKLPYGKLMERILYLRSAFGAGSDWSDVLLPEAEARLRSIQLALEPPVVVCGDASYSMDVAIRCSTIIGSVLTSLTNADLQFFNDKVIRPAIIPRNSRQCLEVATTVKADGLTAPACSLWPLIKQKKAVKFIVMVTDEVENQKSQNAFWPTLFQRYKREVAPDCTPVMISFLENPAVKGRMVNALESMGISPIIQFRLDGSRPDLTKLDSLLGILASESKQFPAQVAVLKEALAKGIDALFERLKTPLIHQEVAQEEETPPPAAAAPVPVKVVMTEEERKAKQAAGQHFCVVCLNGAPDHDGSLWPCMHLRRLCHGHAMGSMSCLQVSS